MWMRWLLTPPSPMKGKPPLERKWLCRATKLIGLQTDGVPLKKFIASFNASCCTNGFRPVCDARAVSRSAMAIVQLKSSIFVIRLSIRCRSLSVWGTPSAICKRKNDMFNNYFAPPKIDTLWTSGFEQFTQFIKTFAKFF